MREEQEERPLLYAMVTMLLIGALAILASMCSPAAVKPCGDACRQVTIGGVIVVGCSCDDRR